MSPQTNSIPDEIMAIAQKAFDDAMVQTEQAHGDYIIAKAIHDAVMAERAWRPIGTAPKTGETIIARLANGEVFSATWHVYGSNPGWHVSSDIGFVTPHHWMPLPATPKAEG